MAKNFTCPCCGAELTADYILKTTKDGIEAFGSRQKYFESIRKNFNKGVADAFEQLYISALEDSAGVGYGQISM